MKKILITIITFACVIVAGIFWIHINQQETDITKTQTKVGFILNGTVDDNSWGESHYIGMEKSAEELNLNVIYRENVPEDDSSRDVMEELIKDGCKILICNSFGYGTWELECAGWGLQELERASLFLWLRQRRRRVAALESRGLLSFQGH